MQERIQAPYSETAVWQLFDRVLADDPAAINEILNWLYYHRTNPIFFDILRNYLKIHPARKMVDPAIIFLKLVEELNHWIWIWSKERRGGLYTDFSRSLLDLYEKGEIPPHPGIESLLQTIYLTNPGSSRVEDLPRWLRNPRLGSVMEALSSENLYKDPHYRSRHLPISDAVSALVRGRVKKYRQNKRYFSFEKATAIHQQGETRGDSGIVLSGVRLAVDENQKLFSSDDTLGASLNRLASEGWVYTLFGEPDSFTSLKDVEAGLAIVIAKEDKQFFIYYQDKGEKIGYKKVALDIPLEKIQGIFDPKRAQELYGQDLKAIEKVEDIKQVQAILESLGSSVALTNDPYACYERARIYLDAETLFKKEDSGFNQHYTYRHAIRDLERAIAQTHLPEALMKRIQFHESAAKEAREHKNDAKYQVETIALLEKLRWLIRQLRQQLLGDFWYLFLPNYDNWYESTNYQAFYAAFVGMGELLDAIIKQYNGDEKTPPAEYNATLSYCLFMAWIEYHTNITPLAGEKSRRYEEYLFRHDEHTLFEPDALKNVKTQFRALCCEAPTQADQEALVTLMLEDSYLPDALKVELLLELPTYLSESFCAKSLEILAYLKNKSTMMTEECCYEIEDSPRRYWHDDNFPSKIRQGTLVTFEKYKDSWILHFRDCNRKYREQKIEDPAQIQRLNQIYPQSAGTVYNPEHLRELKAIAASYDCYTYPMEMRGKAHQAILMTTQYLSHEAKTDFLQWLLESKAPLEKRLDYFEAFIKNASMEHCDAAQLTLFHDISLLLFSQAFQLEDDQAQNENDSKDKVKEANEAESIMLQRLLTLLNDIPDTSPFAVMGQLMLADTIYNKHGHSPKEGMEQALPYYQRAYQALIHHPATYKHESVKHYLKCQLERLIKAEQTTDTWNESENKALNDAIEALLHQKTPLFLMNNETDSTQWRISVSELMEGMLNKIPQEDHQRKAQTVKALIICIYSGVVLPPQQKFYLLRALFMEAGNYLTLDAIPIFIDYAYDLINAAQNEEDIQRIFVLLLSIPENSPLKPFTRYLLEEWHYSSEQINNKIKSDMPPLSVDQSERCKRFLTTAKMKEEAILQAFRIQPEQTKENLKRPLLIVRVFLAIYSGFCHVGHFIASLYGADQSTKNASQLAQASPAEKQPNAVLQVPCAMFANVANNPSGVTQTLVQTQPPQAVYG